MTIQELCGALSSGRLDERFRELYGSGEREYLRQRARYLSAAEHFSRLYPECGDVRVFSAPGRTEIGGNHTDHQHGCVLAAAVDLDVIALVDFTEDGFIRINSEGHKPNEVDLSDLSPRESERGTSNAIIRGIAAGFAEKGVEIGGFAAYTTSDVLSGSGLSSSAAFENLIGTIIDLRYNGGRAGAVETAKIGQFAETVYFGKASGLMDQTVSAVGGFVAIDFADPTAPAITPVRFDFTGAGHSLCITDTKGSHADLIGEYAAVPEEMKSVAACFGAEVLRDVDEDEFYARLPELRETCSDRAILRAAHFFAESQRAVLEAEALAGGDLEEFFRLVNESGTSSAELLQNLAPAGAVGRQEIPLAIMLSKRVLGGCGAVRVHGGGFAGTIQAFVPTYLAETYAAEMDRVFGQGSCRILTVRPVGGTEITV
ncbi:MAG: galactokinase family protein [Ruminococcus sp.]|nr:galactokinase family protein [Ruminococcus sp.]